MEKFLKRFASVAIRHLQLYRPTKCHVRCRRIVYHDWRDMSNLYNDFSILFYSMSSFVSNESWMFYSLHCFLCFLWCYFKNNAWVLSKLILSLDSGKRRCSSVVTTLCGGRHSVAYSRWPTVPTCHSPQLRSTPRHMTIFIDYPNAECNALLHNLDWLKCS